jgi:hypothetical protein
MRRSDMRIRRLLVLALAIVVAVPTAAIAAPKGGGKPEKPSSSRTTCRLPESNADGLELLSTYYQGYWWDHTDLTIAVQAHPNATDEQLEAIHGAIDTWSDVLLRCFDGLITLTDVTGSGNNPHQASDIVVHSAPQFGGVVFGGLALCGSHDCGNVLVSSVPPPGSDFEEYSPEYLAWVTMHEVGHALGLGHATNLEESTDLMGYGWPDLGDPVLSDCDLDALALVFAWALAGEEPHAPADGPYDCSIS